MTCLFLIPETPKYYISWKRFDEARKSLNYVAKFNGSNTRFDDFSFKMEAVSKQDVKGTEAEPLIATSVNEEERIDEI